MDEYDKPLLSVLERPDLLAAYKPVLKAFYGVLKSADAWLKFASPAPRRDESRSTLASS